MKKSKNKFRKFKNYIRVYITALKNFATITANRTVCTSVRWFSQFKNKRYARVGFTVVYDGDNSMSNREIEYISLAVLMV